MGFVGNLLGTNSNYQGSGGFNDLNKSLTQANNTVTSATDQQQAFLNALQAQNGIGNQSSVFNQQQDLANQLQAQTRGEGPNPAMAQLANTTGQNIANQASLMAGQRGVANNPGMMARQIAQQGAATQQNAAGQAAAMRAQQQLAAQQQLQAQQAQMAGLSSQQVGQQSGAIGNLAHMGLQNQQQILGMQQHLNAINAGVAQGNQNANNQIIGGLMGAAGQGAMMMSHGGQIPQHFADGGTSLGIDTSMPNMQPQVSAPQNVNLGVDMGMPGVSQPLAASNYSLGVDTTMPEAQMPGPKSNLGKMANGFSQAYSSDKPLQSGVQSLGGAVAGNVISNAKNFFKPGPASIPIYQDGQQTGERAFSQGGKVPGKPKVFGDDERNDIVPAYLSPGEVVIPRSKVQDPEKVAKFVNAVLGMNLKAGGRV